MKSSSLNPSVANGLNRQIEAFLKDKMEEHKSIIVSHHQEMQVLREYVKQSLEKFDFIFSHLQSQLSEKTIPLELSIARIHDKLKEQDKDSSEKKEYISDIHKKLLDIRCEHASKNDLDFFKKHLSYRLKEYEDNLFKTMEFFQIDVKLSLKDILSGLMKTNDFVGNKFAESEEKLEHKFSQCKMDKESVDKQFKKYSRDIFVLEKKIENIYMILNRMRGENCHKLD